MARIVTASCPSCGANLKLSGDQESVTCDFCKTESLIERPTEHTDNAPRVTTTGHYVIYIQDPESESSGYVSLGIVLVTILAIGGGIIYEHYPELLTPTDSGALTTQTTPAAPDQASSQPGGTSVALTKVDYHDGSHNIRGLFDAEIGQDARVTKIIAYPEYVYIEALSESSDTPVQEYRLRNGEFEEPRTVQVNSSSLRHKADEAFLLSDIDFSLIPALLAKTTKASGLQNLTQRYILVSSLKPRQKPQFHVYIGSEGRTFHCRYRLNGTKIKCN